MEIQNAKMEKIKQTINSKSVYAEIFLETLGIR